MAPKIRNFLKISKNQFKVFQSLVLLLSLNLFGMMQFNIISLLSVTATQSLELLLTSNSCWAFKYIKKYYIK